MVYEKKTTLFWQYTYRLLSTYNEWILDIKYQAVAVVVVGAGAGEGGGSCRRL